MIRHNHFRHCASYVVLLIVCGTTISAAQTADPGGRETVLRLIRQAGKAVQENNRSAALQLLEQAGRQTSAVAQLSIFLQEALKWDIAQLYLERSNEMEDEEQILHFADAAVQKWKDYIQWYGDLSDEQRRTIKGTSSYRIQAAVRHLGNAVVRRGNRGEHSIRELFEKFLDVSPLYFSTESVSLWRYWLFRCPTWQETPIIPYKDLRKRLCGEQDHCREEWESYRDFLEEWKKTPGLPTPLKKRIEREISNLTWTLKCEK
jgi:hypothetical protein